MISARTISIENPFDLRIDKKEILRYLRVRASDPVTDKLIDESIQEICEKSSPRAVYIEGKIEAIENDFICFDFMSVKSHSLSLNLKGCKSACLFAATLGIEVDRVIERYSKILPSKATICHAVGSALVESFCDYVNSVIVDTRESSPRFSAGYGDMSLDYQREILSILDAQRKIGIILSDSLLMSPSKSVTAIIGLKE